MTPERTIQNAILRYLNIHGIFCWKVNNGAVWNAKRQRYQANTTMKGVSDIIGVLPGDGRILALEVKSAKGRVTHEQTNFIATVAACGGVAAIVRSVDEVKSVIERACGAGGATDVLD